MPHREFPDSLKEDTGDIVTATRTSECGLRATQERSLSILRSVPSGTPKGRIDDSLVAACPNSTEALVTYHRQVNSVTTFSDEGHLFEIDGGAEVGYFIGNPRLRDEPCRFKSCTPDSFGGWRNGRRRGRKTPTSTIPRHISAYSSAGSEHLTSNQRVTGSSPVRRTSNESAFNA